MRTVLLAGGSCLMVVAIFGCGSSGDVTVTGEVRHKGTIYKPEAGEQEMVTFGETKNGELSENTFPTRLISRAFRRGNTV